MEKILIVACASIAGIYASEVLKATVLVQPDMPYMSQNVSGYLKLSQEPHGPLTLVGTISGLNPNQLHGIHVHEKGDLLNGCESVGDHYNPEKVHHGDLHGKIHHAGDLGNLKADSNGVAMINIQDAALSLEGKHSVIGRAIVIHSRADDLGEGHDSISTMNGNEGIRWACGIIGIA
ncbi:hypothetical protein QAD02_018771 [Eretmocerus hayati]|uniref:Uncharacterized protein n=1 Tax=Eretmocerus hayati TaxID=131215 RepID=A0ACC2PI30_9HYME|nr:hypothetical protein QAD02_018771 [Eretmocerus hayati]